jgi:hypothetical protein
MLESLHTRSLALPLILGLVLAPLALALEAELPWDQASATELASALSRGVEGILKEAKIERRGGETVKAVENYLLVEDLRSLSRHTRGLARRLKAGEGKSETAPLFSRIELLVRDAAVARRSSTLLTGAQAEIDIARQQLDRLTAYYHAATQPVASE